MDQALTNVIQNLIIDDGVSRNEDSQEDSAVSEDSRDDVALEDDRNEGDATNDRTTSAKTDVRDKNPQARTLSDESWCSLPVPKALRRTSTSNDLPSAVDRSTESSSVGSPTRRRDDENGDDDDDGEITKSESCPPSSSVSHVPTSTDTNTSGAMPVFSIGPFPTPTVSSIKSVQFSIPLIVGPSNRFSAPVFGTAGSENPTGDVVAASIDRSSSSQSDDSTEGKERRSPKLTESVTDSDTVSVDSSSSLDTVREFPTADRGPASSSTLPNKEEPRASASNTQKEATSTKSRTPEEVLAARADRLKRLEEQADWLMKKMNATSRRGSALCTRLEELHDAYGEPPVPPPMPDVLPSRRLPSSLPDLPRQVRETCN